MNGVNSKCLKTQNQNLLFEENTVALAIMRGNGTVSSKPYI